MNKEYYISLIARKLSNELNASQLKDLSTWLSSNKSNSALMDDFKTVWSSTGKYKQSMAINLDDAFSSFTGKYDIPRAEPGVIDSLINKKFNFSLSLPILLLLTLAILSLVYFSGILSNINVKNPNMHAMTVQVDTHSSITLAPESSYKKGKAAFPDIKEKNTLNELESKAISFIQSVREMPIGQSYSPLDLNFEPANSIFIIEDFEGQGFFELRSINEGQAFLGLGNGISVGTRDAAFNIQNYKDESTIVIDVKKGNLFFYGDDGNVYLVLENDRAVFDKEQKTLIRAEKPKVNPFKWHKGVLVFDNTPLSEVFKMIENYYGVNIEVVDGSSLENVNFTATMSMSEDLNDCLDLLHESVNMTITRKGMRDIEIRNIEKG